MHNQRSGVAHFNAETEDEAFAQIRDLLSYLPANNREQPPYRPTLDDPQRGDVELQSIIPDNPQSAVRHARRRLAGASTRAKFLEVMPYHAQNIICGFARLGGHVRRVGGQSAARAGRRARHRCVEQGRALRPVLRLFQRPARDLRRRSGLPSRHRAGVRGIIRHGAKLLYAYCEATVPKLTVITRKAYGGAYDVMCSKHIRADYNLAWPTAEIAVMGPQGAVSVIFKREIAQADDPKQRAQELIEDYREQFANPYFAAERGYIDDVIEPRQTRAALINALHMARNKTRDAPAAQARQHPSVGRTIRAVAAACVQPRAGRAAAAAFRRMACWGLEFCPARDVRLGQRRARARPAALKRWARRAARR